MIRLTTPPDKKLRNGRNKSFDHKILNDEVSDMIEEVDGEVFKWIENLKYILWHLND